MRSLERSHRGKDLDQVDPEHINRVAAEFSWDDLNKVPFRGNRQQSSKKPTSTAENLKQSIENLLDDDETIKAKREEEARQRVQAVFQEMDGIGAFGKYARNGELTQEYNERIIRAQEANRDSNRDQKLSDISGTF